MNKMFALLLLTSMNLSIAIDFDFDGGMDTDDYQDFIYKDAYYSAENDLDRLVLSRYTFKKDAQAFLSTGFYEEEILQHFSKKRLQYGTLIVFQKNEKTLIKMIRDRDR